MPICLTLTLYWVCYGVYLKGSIFVKRKSTHYRVSVYFCCISTRVILVIFTSVNLLSILLPGILLLFPIKWVLFFATNTLYITLCLYTGDSLVSISLTFGHLSIVNNICGLGLTRRGQFSALGCDEELQVCTDRTNNTWSKKIKLVVKTTGKRGVIKIFFRQPVQQFRFVV